LVTGRRQTLRIREFVVGIVDDGLDTIDE